MDKERLNIFAKKVKVLREKKGLTQQDIENRTGIFKSSISAFELGKKRPTADHLLLLSDVFGCSIDDLLGDNKEKEFYFSRTSRQIEFLKEMVDAEKLGKNDAIALDYQLEDFIKKNIKKIYKDDQGELREIKQMEIANIIFEEIKKRAKG